MPFSCLGNGTSKPPKCHFQALEMAFVILKNKEFRKRPPTSRQLPITPLFIGGSGMGGVVL
jgi:hypothetical protein